jgi:glycosyltransferase involved in cell wall biosynthesis
MLSGLIDHGYEIHMLVPRAAEVVEPVPSLHVHTIPNVLAVPAAIPAPLRRLWLLPAFWSVAARASIRLAREVRPRLTLGFSHYGAWPAYQAGRAAGVPSVLKLFGVMHAMRLEWPLPRYLYHSLEGVLAFKVPLSHFIILNDGTLGRRVAERWGVAPERITYLPNGIDTQWGQLELQRDAVRTELGVDPGRVVLLSLSRLVESKRVDRIVDAVADAAVRTSTPLELWIAGDGPRRRALEKRCQKRAIQHRFLGSVRRDRVPHLLAAADALLSTSELTNMSIPTCEAMVVGTPVIALDVGGTREVVRHEQTGIVVPEGNAEALSTAVLRLADDPEFRQRCGRQARRFAADHFMSWPERVAAEIDVLDRLVQAAPPASRELVT